MEHPEHEWNILNMNDREIMTCDSCGCSESKYRCPECSRRSCRRHKLEHGCSGSRCKTAFVPLNKFSDNLLYSDYCFLEDVNRCVDSVRRHLTDKKREWRGTRGQGQRFHWLKREATKRGVKLHLLPQGMSRHKANTSHTLKMGGCLENGSRTAARGWKIHWCLDLLFPQAEAEFHDENVPESLLLQELLDRYIHPTSSNPIVRHQLSAYVASADDVEVLMEDSRQPAVQIYHRLNKRETLRENLVGKTIIEFPRIIVILGSHLKDYTLNAVPITDISTSSVCCSTISTSALPTSTLPSSAISDSNTANAISIAAAPQRGEPDSVLPCVSEEQHCSDSEWCGGEGAFALTLIAQSYNSDSCASDA